MSDIFLSYNREDQAAADLFVEGFEAAGLSVWWDQRLRAGEAYDEVTEAALRNAKAVVVLWSKRSVASRWVRAEATLAQRSGSFVPCMIEECDRPIMFELTQTEDLSHWRGNQDDPDWRAFVAHVRDVVGKQSQPDKAEQEAARPAPKAAIPPAEPAPSVPVSERRQITFVSASLDGGDQLVSSIDPEDWHDFLTDLQTLSKPIIERYGGRATWTGHCLTITFGFPVAMEDAARRAIRTAKELQLAAGQLASPGRGADQTNCQLNIGVHASDMLVRGAGDNLELVGDGAATSEAARDRADPGSIVVTAAIRSMASAAYRMEEIADTHHGHPLFRVTGTARDTSTRRDWDTGEQTAFVGREDEIAHLRRRWSRTLDGEGQFVLVRGEPGIGKSRLIDHFESEIEGTEHTSFTLQGSSLFPNTPFYPLAKMIEYATDHGNGDTQETLSRRLEELGFPPEIEPAVAAVVGIGSDADPASAVTSDAQRPHLLSSLANSVFQLSERSPVVLWLDDLQWFDPSTLELVQMLIEQGDTERLMVLGTARPEFELPWSERDHHSRINLARLSNSDIAELIAEASGDAEIGGKTLEAILEKVDGVPLFAEELAKLASSTEGQGHLGKLPPTLRSLLAARMDRLGPARGLLQVCSVLGACPYQVLSSMADIDTGDLDKQLRQLTEEQLLIVRGAPPNSSYRFKHALLQDGAYETLTRKARQQLHERAATTIRDQFPDIAELEKERLATHWTRAGKTEEAVAAWLEAGKREFTRGASREAAAHLKKGLGLVGDLPEGSERDRQEMELWSALNNALQQSLGYSNPQTLEAADKASALAKKLGLLSDVITSEVQRWRGTVNAGNYKEADEVAARINDLAGQLGADEQPGWMPFFSANALVQTAYYNGRLRDFEEPYAELEHLFGQHEGMVSVNDDVVAMGVASLAAWAAGRSPLARQRIAQTIEVAEGSGQPYAAAVAHHFAGTLMAFDRDMEEARRHTERALEICDTNEIEFIGQLVRAKIGWLSNDAAPSAQNITAMREILEAMVALNGRVGLVINMNRLAMALEAREELDEAYTAACEALEANPQERIVRPETLQIKARLEEKMGRPDEAEADFKAAIDLAGETGAAAFELSASAEYACFLQRSGRHGEALAIIRGAIENCGPEIDTPALADVKALQAELADVSV